MVYALYCLQREVSYLFDFIDKQIETFEVPFLSDWLVREYLKLKHEYLKDALDGKYLPECKPRNLWNGRRCDYCTVAAECKALRKGDK